MSKRLNMSNDEAVEWLLSLKNLDICGENRKTAIDKAITALKSTKKKEQEGVLDKIKAEINTMPCAITSMREIYVRRDKVINILDKYKAESEE